MRRLLRTRPAGRASTAGPTRIAGIELSALVAASSAGTVVTKVGRLSLRGVTTDGTRVKVVEAHSPAHAQLIVDLARGALSEFMPPVLGMEGSLVVSAWVERAPRAPDPDPRVLAGLLARVHAATVPAAAASFDPWADHVLPRARRAAAALDASTELETYLAPALELAAATPPHVAHPDVTPDNVIPRSDGGLSIIDNELLGVSSSPWLDLANLARGVKRDRSSALDAYVRAGGREPSADELHGVRAMWLARMLGSWFLAGRLHDARAMLSAGVDSLRLPFER